MILRYIFIFLFISLFLNVSFDYAIAQEVPVSQPEVLQEPIYKEEAKPKTKVELIERLIKLNGTREALERNLNRVIDEAPEERRQELQNLFDIDEIIINIIPIYHKYFSQEDLANLVVFYETPTGTKALEVTPKIMAEAMEATLTYFAEKSGLQTP